MCKIMCSYTGNCNGSQITCSNLHIFAVILKDRYVKAKTDKKLKKNLFFCVHAIKDVTDKNSPYSSERSRSLSF